MPLAHADDVEWETVDQGDVRFRRKRFSQAADGEDLGCSLYELPAGHRSWPFHYHTGNEEALYILEGSGLLRLTDAEVSLQTGTYVALPEGKSGAHQVINDSGEPLRYLALSTMREPDVTVYPDTDRIGVFAGSPPGSSEAREVHGFYNREETVDYWEDEGSE